MNFPSPFSIRPALASDASAIARIYNHFVLNSTSTFQCEPESVAFRRNLLRKRRPEHPAFVAERAGKVVGWAALSAHSSKEGWRFTVENSIYIAENSQGKGLGRLLLGKLIESAQQQGLHVIIARISADQRASLALHGKMGFVEAGRLSQVGRKFGKWLDVVVMQKVIGG